MLDKAAIVKKMKELNLPTDQYLVLSGGSLAAHGIRQTSDIDIVADEDLFAQLKKTGQWKLTKRYQDETEFLEGEVVDIASRLEWSDYQTTFSVARSRADIIEGVPFMSLDDLIEFKQAMSREKDFADIASINEYLEASG